MVSGEESGPEGVLRPLDWSRRIEEALERDLFVLHGQRIVDVATGATMRHELFLRMVDRTRLIPAGEFVMAAEEFGSIREIDRWVVGAGDRGRGDRTAGGPQPQREVDG